MPLARSPTTKPSTSQSSQKNKRQLLDKPKSKDITVDEDEIVVSLTSQSSQKNRRKPLDKPKSKEITVDEDEIMVSLNCICMKCNRKVKENQKGIQCEYCDIWFHISCGDLGEEEYEKLKNLGDKASWYCKSCTSRIKDMKKEIQVLKCERSEFIKGNSEMFTTVKELREEINTYSWTLENKITLKIDEEMNEYKMIIKDEIIRKVDEQMKNFHQNKSEEIIEKLNEEIEISNKRVKVEILQKFDEEISAGWNRWNKAREDMDQTNSKYKKMQDMYEKLRTDLKDLEQGIEAIRTTKTDDKSQNQENVDLNKGKDTYSSIVMENNNLEKKVNSIERKVMERLTQAEIRESSSITTDKTLKNKLEECMRENTEEERNEEK